MLSKNEKGKVLKARSNRNGRNKSTNSGGQTNCGGANNNVHGKWKSRISMLENKARNQKRQMLVFNNTAKPGSDDEESDVSEKEYGNLKHDDLTRQ